MKRVYNKDGSVDIIAKWEEVTPYILGCAISGNQDKVVIRTRGSVKDLKDMIIDKKILKKKRRK